jgi:hypothetical protein
MLVELLDRWIAAGKGPLVPVGPGVGLRADLFAGRLLRRLRSEPQASEAIAARDARHATLVEEAMGRAGDEAVLEAVRRAVATPAAARGREELWARREAREDLAEAAHLVADLRLDPTAGPSPHTKEARVRAAGLQRQEAALLARAGHGRRARRLLADLDRWAPALEPGEAAPWEAVRRQLARAVGWRPTGAPPTRLDVWADLEPPTAAAGLRNVVVPEPIGPGAPGSGDRFVLFRGLGVELWSREEEARLAAFEGAGEGWFGGSVREVAPWLPGRGVIVSSVAAGEPADRAGVIAGDWIRTWAGKTVLDTSHFMWCAANATPGVPVDLEVRRRGRVVLDRLVPGRRPLEEGDVLARDTVWTTADGRMLVPGRLDVSWIDSREATKEVLWRWDGTGVVRALHVTGSTVVVTVRRALKRDALVALDIATGAERWRTPIEGTVLDVASTGSALVVTASDPAHVTVLDPRDGSPRARVHVHERLRNAYAHTLVPALPVVNVHGRVWCLTDDPDGGEDARLLVLNATTGDTYAETVDSDGVDLLLAGDGVVALSPGDAQLLLLAPDPVTGDPAWRTDLGIAGQPMPWGFLPSGADARIAVAGDRLYVLNVPAGAWPRLEVVELDLAALGPGQPRGRVKATRVIRPRGSRQLYHGLDAWPYVLDARATLEGYLVTVASTGDRQRRVVVWLDRGGRGLSWHDPMRESTGVLSVRRHAPTRVGDVLVLPTDDGAQLVPLATGVR